MYEAHDQYGNSIEAGDYITYPVRRGSDLYVQTGRVLRVDTRLRRVSKGNFEEEVVLRVAANSPSDFDLLRKVTISRPDRTVVLPKSYVQNTVVQTGTSVDVQVVDNRPW
jgi:hypothetical protein